MRNPPELAWVLLVQINTLVYDTVKIIASLIQRHEFFVNNFQVDEILLVDMNRSSVAEKKARQTNLIKSEFADIIHNSRIDTADGFCSRLLVHICTI